MRQFFVTSAFTQACIDTEIYVDPPKGFETKGDAVREYIESNYGFVAYSDASWRSAANKYSSYGYIVYLFGGVVSFASKYLKIVAMSSAEAEYAAASQACREIDHDPSDCDACQAGASRRRPFPKRTAQQFTMFGQRLRAHRLERRSYSFT